jgi:4-amino-4-deoxy-L-arabinose transferase-like glycosyltransferase
MTTLVRPRILAPGEARPGPVGLVGRLIRGREEDSPWVRPAFLGVTALAAVLYLWNLAANGFANSYYSMAAQAASQSWSSFFFGSLDAGNFITIDKPPLAIWLMGLSVRLLGLNSWAILLPEAILGIATVVLLFVTVRRSFGPVAAVIAGLAMALTPVAVLMFRFNNPDALLTFLLVASAAALLYSFETGHRRWLLAAGVLVGLAFNAKFLQAYLVLPAFALTVLVAAPGSLRRRIVDLLALGVAIIVASAWWVAVVEILPATTRPYIGGSTTNSALDLLFGYDGLGRIFGFFGLDGGGGGGGGANFGGVAGVLRLFNAEWAGQIAWLLPFAAVALVGGLWFRRRSGRTDPGVAGYLLWGGWLLVTAAVFSFMSGTVHPYYAVALAPAIAALVGAGAVDLWRLRAQSRFGGLPLAAAILATVVVAVALLARTPEFLPGLDVAIIAVGVAAAVVVAVPASLVPRRVALVVAAAGLAAVMAAPTAFALDTVGTVYSGSTPSAGPSMGASGFGDRAAGGFDGAGQPDAGTTPSGTPPSGTPPSGTPPSGTAVQGTAGAPSAIGDGGFGGGDRGGSLDQALIDYLVANRGSATWLVAVSGSQQAASIQLSTGIPVMAIGGFTGSDPAPSLEQLQAWVASGQLRFLFLGGSGQGGPGLGGSGGTASERDAWVTATCSPVTDAVSSSGSGGGTLYDCSGAAGTSGG